VCAKVPGVLNRGPSFPTKGGGGGSPTSVEHREAAVSFTQMCMSQVGAAHDNGTAFCLISSL
jgi:hypothetical protein